MKAKLLICIVTLLFSSDVLAEYYLVYPVANVSCGDCYYHKTYKKHYRKKTHRVRHHRHHYNSYHRPCGAVVRCSVCGEYVNTTCGRPDYLIYMGPPRDCVTYEDVVESQEYFY